jgi:hypothetical protein
MSLVKDRAKKERRKAKGDGYKRVRNRIRSGLYPRFMFRKVTLEDGRTEILEPRKLTYMTSPTGERMYHKSGLTLRLVSVIKAMLED